MEETVAIHASGESEECVDRREHEDDCERVFQSGTPTSALRAGRTSGAVSGKMVSTFARRPLELAVTTA